MSSSNSSKKNRSIPFAILRISVSSNNTLASISDHSGNILSWSSAGVLGFKGAKKSTPYVASLVVLDAIKKVQQFNIKSLGVRIKGIHFSRDAALKALINLDMVVVYIRECTPVPHNGCRPKKRRKV